MYQYFLKMILINNPIKPFPTITTNDDCSSEKIILFNFEEQGAAMKKEVF